jgi:hypothetical protein
MTDQYLQYVIVGRVQCVVIIKLVSHSHFHRLVRPPSSTTRATFYAAFALQYLLHGVEDSAALQVSAVDDDVEKMN